MNTCDNNYVALKLTRSADEKAVCSMHNHTFQLSKLSSFDIMNVDAYHMVHLCENIFSQGPSVYQILL